jgi:LacI family transcriptional regulator
VHDAFFLHESLAAGYLSKFAIPMNPSISLRHRRAGRGLAETIRDVNGFRSLEMILDQKCPFTAIFTGTDDVAHGFLDALQHRSLSVPADISVVGFDNQPPPYRSVELTTVRVEAKKIGRQLARMTVTKIQSKGKILPEVTVPTKLMKRSTCRPIFQGTLREAELKVL